MSKNRETSERETVKGLPNRVETSERDLPLVVLGEMVIMPHMTVPLQVGQGKSYRAMEQAWEEDQEVLLLLLQVGEPALHDDLHRIGDDPLRHFTGLDLLTERTEGAERPAADLGDLLLHRLEKLQVGNPALGDALHQRRRDDQPVDLVGALEDAVDAGVAAICRQ